MRVLLTPKKNWSNEQWLARYEKGGGLFCTGSSRDSAFDFDSGRHCSVTWTSVS